MNRESLEKALVPSVIGAGHDVVVHMCGNQRYKITVNDHVEAGVNFAFAYPAVEAKYKRFL